jgi:hypothetical protein
MGIHGRSTHKRPFPKLIFERRQGKNDRPAGWPAAPAASELTLRAAQSQGAGLTRLNPTRPRPDPDADPDADPDPT